MKLITVSGASSAAGKTALMEALITRLRDTRPPPAIKITVTHDVVQGCPRGGSGCGVCASVPSGYSIVTDPTLIEQPGTDTGRFWARGARPVLWAITRPTWLLQAWEEMLRQIDPAQPILVESNSLAVLRTPNLSFFTINPRVSRTRWKSSAEQLSRRSDFVIVSRNMAQDDRADALHQELSSIRENLPTLLVPTVEEATDLPQVQMRLQEIVKAS